MSSQMYLPGQRWVSQTEAEMGLGIVLENNGRHLTISFPAAGERRTYAVEEAPLTRVIYHPGDSITSIDNLTIIVSETSEQQGCILYSGHDKNGDHHQIPELELDSFIQFSKPQDRLFAGQIDKLSDFQLRYQTLNLQHRLQQSPARGLLGPRVELLPHQLYIASSVAERHAPRVLLADEVGLGKTIEAGLIIHQQLTTGRCQRVLIAVPEALQHQWLVEMLRRFNLPFSLLDEERCQALIESGHDNPFETEQLVLCGLPLITQNETRLQQALSCRWDLLVVDEAHHLQWQEDTPEDEKPNSPYHCIEALAQHAAGLIMLTATPEQLGLESHFARLRLLDPDRYHSLEAFCEEEANYRPLNDLVQAINSGELSGDQLQQLQALVGNERATQWQEHPQKITRELLDRHGTGRVLFRNTRSSVEGFPERKLCEHPLAPPQGYDESQHTELQQRLQPEHLLGDNWTEIDPRVSWLQGWLKENRQRKVLVICAKANTALDLETHLRLRGGARSTAFHEGMTLLERDRAAAYFADDIDGAQVMVCSEIGSEGRNFQFAHHMVLFDLPLNPDLLEQRIGRLDRIGQQHTVNIHVPYYSDSAKATATSTMVRWYHEGINGFEKVCPIGQGIFDRFKAKLLEQLETTNNDQLDALINDTRAYTEQTLAELQAGRNQLLELNSCNPEQAQTLIDAIQSQDDRDQLTDYMTQVFDTYGVDQERHSENASVIHPSDHMHCEHFPGLPREGMTATFDRTQALSREDMQFLTWEHPMVSGCMDMISGSERGNTALCTIKLPPLKPGTLMVETVYQLYCPAPKQFQIQRFFSGACLRLVIDNNQRDLSNIISFDHINKLSERVKLKVGQQLVRQGRDRISAVISHSQKLAEAQQEPLIKEARQQLLDQTQAEIDRLKALAEVNPNIRQEEIEYLQAVQAEQLNYLAQTQLRLDAVRVIVAT
ncbi:RNA polymerase-associated protein RapA [Maricurvus nonylphenolicus]|uniref:RNA polymerase-associated protein RapA n=1 Tax=Maricurvus nonylphenolicus TaxID=1008307 RepID=UPI0036F1A92D